MKEQTREFKGSHHSELPKGEDKEMHVWCWPPHEGSIYHKEPQHLGYALFSLLPLCRRYESYFPTTIRFLNHLHNPNPTLDHRTLRTICTSMHLFPFLSVFSTNAVFFVQFSFF